MANCTSFERLTYLWNVNATCGSIELHRGGEEATIRMERGVDVTRFADRNLLHPVEFTREKRETLVRQWSGDAPCDFSALAPNAMLTFTSERGRQRKIGLVITDAKCSKGGGLTFRTRVVPVRGECKKKTKSGRRVCMCMANAALFIDSSNSEDVTFPLGDADTGEVTVGVTINNIDQIANNNASAKFTISNPSTPGFSPTVKSNQSSLQFATPIDGPTVTVSPSQRSETVQFAFGTFAFRWVPETAQTEVQQIFQAFHPGSSKSWTITVNKAKTGATTTLVRPGISTATGSQSLASASSSINFGIPCGSVNFVAATNGAYLESVQWNSAAPCLFNVVFDEASAGTTKDGVRASSPWFSSTGVSDVQFDVSGELAEFTFDPQNGMLTVQTGL